MSADVDPYVSAVFVAEALLEAVENGRIDLAEEPWLRKRLRIYTDATGDTHAAPESGGSDRG